MFKSILITLISLSLFAGDISKAKDPEKCLPYKEQQIRYLDKAKKNEKMSSRYNLVAGQYKEMFNACKKDFYSPKSMMRITPGSQPIQKVNSYRVNPYN